MTDIKRNASKKVELPAEPDGTVAVQYGNVDALKLALLNNVNQNLRTIITLLKEKK